jgi:tetratricopeptide (TPR) repeat protein
MKKNIKTPLSQSDLSLKEKGIALLLLILPALIAYWPVLSFDFVNWDDPYYVYKNDNINGLSLKHLKTLFSTQTIVMGNWHPFTMLSLAIDRSIWGLNPQGYHLTNLLLHLLNSILATALVWKLFKQKHAALLTGMAFALHPLHIESVAWITERKDVLYTAFYLGAWLAWTRANNGYLYYLLSLVLFSAACLSKAMAVTLPVVILLTEYFYANTKRLKSLIPFFILAVVFGLIGISAQKSAQAIAYQEGFTLFDNACIAGYNVWFYLSKILWPHPLSAFYPYPEKSGNLLPLPYLLGFVASAIAVAVTVWMMLRGHRISAFLSAIFFVTIFPVIQLIPLGEAMAADRYTYLSSWPVFTGLFIGISRLAASRKTPEYFVLLFGLTACVLWSVGIRQRLPVWQSGEPLWNDVIEQYPDLYFAWNNLGTLYYEKQQFDKAIPVYQKVLEMNPDYKDGHNNLGSIFATRQSYDSAIVHFEKAVQLDTNYIAAIFNLGYAYSLKGRTTEGLPMLQKAARNGHQHAQQILTQNKLSW